MPAANTQPLRIVTSQPIQTTIQPTQTTNVVIPSQNITTIATLNTSI